jgi:hypothetical protein
LIPLSWLGRVIHPRPCRASRAYTHQPSAWAPSGALWGWHAPMGPWDDLTVSLTPSLNPSLCLPHCVSDSESESENDSD